METQKRFEVKVTTFPETKLIGIEKVIGDEWPFDVFYAAYPHIFRNAPNRKYPYPNSEFAEFAASEILADGRWQYFIGIEVSNFENVPEGAIGRIFPTQLCAVVEQPEDVDYKTFYKDATGYVYGEWLEQHTYMIDHRFPGAWEHFPPEKNKIFFIYLSKP